MIKQTTNVLQQRREIVRRSKVADELRSILKKRIVEEANFEAM